MAEVVDLGQRVIAEELLDKTVQDATYEAKCVNERRQDLVSVLRTQERSEIMRVLLEALAALKELDLERDGEHAQDELGEAVLKQPQVE